MGVRWYVIVILSSIYLMTRDAENHFICLLAIIGEMYVQSFVHILIELFGGVFIVEL